MEKFNQVCVWPATVVGEADVAEFEQWVKNDLGTRIQYCEEVLTNPTPGNEIDEPGGRNDLFFKVHDDDIQKFAVARLKYGMRWWEDILNNGHAPLYPQDVLNKYPKTW